MNLLGRKITVVLLVLTLHAVALLGLWRMQPVAPPAEAIPLIVELVAVTTPAATPELAPKKEKPPLKPQVSRQSQPQLAPQAQSPQQPQQALHEPAASPVPAAQLPLTQVPEAAQTSTLGPKAMDTAPAHRAPVALAPSDAGIQPAAGSLVLSTELSLVCPTHSAPSYPALSRRLNEQGVVLLHVVLNEEGAVTGARVQDSSGFARLDNAALAAVRSWRCSAPRRNGVSVPATALQPFRFQLQ